MWSLLWSTALRCLVVPSNTDGQQVNLIPCPRDLTPNTTFTLTAGSAPQDGADFARGPVTQLQIYGDKCVDVTDGVNAEGTALQIWTCDAQNANPNQRFNVNEKFFMYEIEWAAHGLCAGVGNKKDPNAVRVPSYVLSLRSDECSCALRIGAFQPLLSPPTMKAFQSAMASYLRRSPRCGTPHAQRTE